MELLAEHHKSGIVRDMGSTSTRVVIVGGGAGGLKLATRLASQKRIQVYLIDQSATHIWKPRLHEMAAGARRGMVDEITYTRLAERWGFAFFQGKLCDVDPKAHRIALAPMENAEGRAVVGKRALAYDVLVLAAGGVTSDLGVEGVTEHAFMLDHVADAEAILSRFSLAALETMSAGQTKAMNIVIVGSSFTGVELAAYLAAGAQSAKPAQRYAQPEINVTLMESGNKLMPGAGQAERSAIRQRLEGANVTIRTSCRISRVKAGSIETSHGETYDSQLTVWATGRVGPIAATGISLLETNRKHQWRVHETLQTLASPDIFALGDCASIDDTEVPPTAQAAGEQALHLARELPRYCNGLTPSAFEFRNKSALMSLGAAGAIGRLCRGLDHDLQIRGRAYRGLERQHDMLVFGKLRGSGRLLAQLLSPRQGPRVKVY